MEEATNDETIDEVLIEGHPFKTTFPPPKRMSPAQSDERMAEIKRRAGLPPGALVPPASACEETISTAETGVVTGRSRGYVPYERDSNCDFSGALAQFPCALAIDGTGHDNGSDAAKHSENGRTMLSELESCIQECLSDVHLPRQLADRVLAHLQALDAPGETRKIHHMSCTLSVAIKVEAKKKAYALTWHWGDNIVFVANPKKRSFALINPPLNSDYGIGSTHCVTASRKQGESLLPYSMCVRELEADDYIVCVTDGVWDHFVVAGAPAKKNEPPELDVSALLDIFDKATADHDDVEDGEQQRNELLVGRLFEEARIRARAKLEAKAIREAELDDMSAFVIPPSTPPLVLSPGHNKQDKDKSCTLS